MVNQIKTEQRGNNNWNVGTGNVTNNRTINNKSTTINQQQQQTNKIPT